MTSDIRVRFIQCDHSCGGKPVKYATPGVTGFVCARCGAEVADVSKARLPQQKARDKLPNGVRRQYF